MRQCSGWVAATVALITAAQLHAQPAEADPEPPMESPQAPADLPPDAPGEISKDDFEIYGFTQLDVIYDFQRVNPDWTGAFRPTRIATRGEYGTGSQTTLQVRQSRFGVVGDGIIADRPYKVNFEFDLFGVGANAGQTTFRMRRAYASWGPVLAGQTDSLFMDGSIFPNLYDAWGPSGMVLVRNPQLRLTFVETSDWKAAIAVEKPDFGIDAGNIRLIDPELATNLRQRSPLPDLTVQLRYGDDAGWGHVQLGAVLRKIAFETSGRPGGEPRGSETGWGINTTAVVRVAQPVILRMGNTIGRGIGAFMNDGGPDIAPTEALVPLPQIFPAPPVNRLVGSEALFQWSISAFADIAWTRTLASTIGYSQNRVRNTSFQASEAMRLGQYASASLVWSPVARAAVALGYLWGRREDLDGASGTANRIQLSFKFKFSSNDLQR